MFLLQPAAPGFLSDLVMVERFRTGARLRTPRAFILICEAVLSAVPPLFIFVRSLFPNVGWHNRVSYSDDYSKRMLGSDQHCCRKPTYYEPCKREKNVFLLQPAARVSFRSCYGSALLDRGFWLCGLCLLLRVGSASGFPEACPQVLSPSATTRQAPWRGKKCAYLWRRAPPRARPRDVRSWQQEASAVVCTPHSRCVLFGLARHPSWLAVTAVVELTPHACQRLWNDKSKGGLSWVPAFFAAFLAAFAALLASAAGALCSLVPFFL